MTTSYLSYPLHPDGYIDHWLLANTYAYWVKNLEDFPGSDFKLLIAQHFYTRASKLSAEPLEGESFTANGQTLAWKAVRCPDDHMLDISVFHHNCHYLAAWAYAVIESDYAGPATFVLGTNGPADLWLNGKHVHRQEHFHHQDPLCV